MFNMKQSDLGPHCLHAIKDKSVVQAKYLKQVTFVF